MEIRFGTALTAAEWWQAMETAGPKLLPSDWLVVRKAGQLRFWCVHVPLLLRRLHECVPGTSDWSNLDIRRALVNDPAWRPVRRGPSGDFDKTHFPALGGTYRYWLWSEADLPAAVRALLSPSA